MNIYSTKVTRKCYDQNTLGWSTYVNTVHLGCLSTASRGCQEYLHCCALCLVFRWWLYVVIVVEENAHYYNLFVSVFQGSRCSWKVEQVVIIVFVFTDSFSNMIIIQTPIFINCFSNMIIIKDDMMIMMVIIMSISKVI